MKTLNIITLVSIFVTYVNCMNIPSSSIVKEALTTINKSYFNHTNNINVLFKGNNVKAKRYEFDYSDANFIACQKEQMDFEECYTDATDDIETCKILKGERCDNFYKNPAAYLPSCEKFDKSIAEGIYSLYKYMGSIAQYLCANNRRCAITMKIKINAQLSTEENYSTVFPNENDLKEDCSNKECHEAMVKMYENQRSCYKINRDVDTEKGETFTEKETKTYNETMNSLDKVLEQLKSPTCTQQIDIVDETFKVIESSTSKIKESDTARKNKNDDINVSGAAKINASNILLFSIISFILLFKM